uniref:Uncharacterized protein n=1 Tax=Schistocephalus solidus TaxID=70667 RepID=A0A0V0J6N7_SCHSO
MFCEIRYVLRIPLSQKTSPDQPFASQERPHCSSNAPEKANNILHLTTNSKELAGLANSGFGGRTLLFLRIFQNHHQKHAIFVADNSSSLTNLVRGRLVRSGPTHYRQLGYA